MRAAYAPAEDPMTLRVPASLSAHFLKLAVLDLARTGRCFSVTSSGKLVELAPPECRVRS